MEEGIRTEKGDYVEVHSQNRVVDLVVIKQNNPTLHREWDKHYSPKEKRDVIGKPKTRELIIGMGYAGFNVIYPDGGRKECSGFIPGFDKEVDKYASYLALINKNYRDPLLQHLINRSSREGLA